MKFNEKFSNIIFLGLLIIAILFFGFVVELIGWSNLFWVILIIMGIFFTIHLIKKIKLIFNEKYLEENKYAIQGYMFLWGIIYFVLAGILTFLNIWTKLVAWTFIVQLVVFTLISLYKPIKNLFESIESDRISNKKGIFFQYFIKLPKNILLLVLSSIPFFLITYLFYYVGNHTSFIRTICLPILGGFIGEYIWGGSFFLIYVYLNYKTYQLLDKFFDK
jgi:hypothetical protein